MNTLPHAKKKSTLITRHVERNWKTIKYSGTGHAKKKPSVLAQPGQHTHFGGKSVPCTRKNSFSIRSGFRDDCFSSQMSACLFSVLVPSFFFSV